MNFQETLDYLFSLLPMYQRVGNIAFKKDLSNTIKLCDALGKPEHKFKSVHIAGTNGKGSSAHATAAILQLAGYKTGLYTSPHLKCFTERIKIDGQAIPQSKVVIWVEQHKSLMEEVMPSFFELTVAMAFDYFASEQVDIAVIEVGMGGRLDSTNVIVPEVSLITNIGFDHQSILGNTLPEIGREKAGIIKAGIPVVIGSRQAEVEGVFQEVAQEKRAPIVFAPDVVQVIADADQNKISLQRNGELFLEDIHPSLGSKYFLKNIPGIVETIFALQDKGYNIENHQIKKGLEEFRQLTDFKGRWQVLSENPLIVCDISHNQPGLEELFNQVVNLSYKSLYLIYGATNDKDLSKIFPLFPKEAFYYFCEANVPRAMAADTIYSEAEKFGLRGKIVKNVNDALGEARKLASSQDMILVTGSTFVVAEIDEL